MESTTNTLRVFLCHSVDDKPAVRDLYKRLSTIGLDVWLDEVKLLPGQDWDLEITKAVLSSHVIIICLSRSSVKKVGYVQVEIRRALRAAERQPEGSLFLVPLRLDDCDIPYGLQPWQWVDFFSADGDEKLLAAIRARSDELGIPLLAVQRLLTSIRSAIERFAFADVVTAAALIDPAILPLTALQELAEALFVSYSHIPSDSPAYLTALLKLIDCFSHLSTLLPNDVLIKLRLSMIRARYARALLTAGQYEEALKELMPLLNFKLPDASSPRWRAVQATAQGLYTIALDHLHRYKDVVEFVDQYLDSWRDDPLFLESWVFLSVSKAGALAKLGYPEKSDLITQQTLERCRASSDPMNGIKALQTGITYIEDLDHDGPAILLLECILAIAQGHENRHFREAEADSYFKLARYRRRAGDYEGAITTCAELFGRFTAYETPDIEASVAWGMTEYQRSLRDTKQFEKAAEVAQQVFDKFKRSTNQDTLKAVAWAYAEKGKALQGLEDYPGALAAFTAFLEHFDVPKPPSPTGDEENYTWQIIFSLGEKASCLGKLEQFEASVAVCDQAIERFRDICNVNIQEEVAWCLVEKAYNLRMSRRIDEASDVYQSVIRTFNNTGHEGIRREVRAAINGLGMCSLYRAKQASLEGNEEGAISLTTEAETFLQEANAIARKANSLGSLGYIAFLRGELSAARSLITEAYTLGGDDWRSDEIKNICLITLPQDSVFLGMLKELAITEAEQIKGPR